MPGTIPKSIWVYRIVHVDNIEFILTHGMHAKDHPERDTNYVNIGLPQIQGLRSSQPVRIRNHSHLADGYLTNYIAFYFGQRQPMLYKIQTGHGGVTMRPPSDIVYVCCKLDVLRAECAKVIFTDGHASKIISSHYDDFNLLTEVDWNMVNEREWNDTDDDNDRKRRKQAELLVHSHVPPSCIGGLVVYNAASKTKIETIMNKLKIQIPVKINHELYY
ncbi:MAG: DUF4433 domain-containing protein [Candidatus Kapaibacterium sp.]